jgi:hypothetical protein
MHHDGHAGDRDFVAGKSIRSWQVTRRSRGERRGALLVVAALLGGLCAGALWAHRARACPPPINYGPNKVVTKEHQGRTEVRLNFRRRGLVFKGGNLNLSEVRVFTRDERLVAWLQRHGMKEPVWKAIERVGQRTRCDALLSGRSIWRLERRLAVAVARAYRRATGRRVRRPDLMLVSGVLARAPMRCQP